MTVALTLRSRCALALGILAVLGSAHAQEPVDRPAAARRIVAQFDFDKPEPFSIPRYWDLAQDGSKAGGVRPGFPIFNSAEHDATVAYRGSGSVRLLTRGGSTCLRLDSGVVPIFGETEYLISAKVRTKGLSQAKAAISARYLDRTGAPVPGTDVRSDLVVTAADQWTLIAVPLQGKDAAAAYVQVDLEILQPDQFQKAELGRHQLWPNEFPAEAWFDDVTVVQLPRVTISTDSPTNLVTGAPPEIKVAVRDLTGEEITGRLIVQDAAGRIVDEQIRPPGAGLVAWSWTPKLARYGWYRASMELRTENRRVGGTHVDFAWLPADQAASGSSGAGRADRTRFGITLEELPPGSLEMLPGILSQIGTGSVSIPIWTPDQTADLVRQLAAQLVGPVAELKVGWQDVTFALPRTPRELAESARLEPEDVTGLFAKEEKVWLPYLLPFVDKYGQTVRRWQIGKIGDIPPRTAENASRIARLESLLSRMVPGPVVAVPWPAELVSTPASRGTGIGDLLVDLPYAAPPQAIPLLGAAWAESVGTGPPAVTIAMGLLPSEQFTRQESASHLVKRVVEAWSVFCAAGAERSGGVTLIQPWDWPTPDSKQVMPRAELAAYANAAAHLAGRRVVGKLPGSGGITCYILAPVAGSAARTGALVAWSDEPSQDAVIEAFLGDGDIRAVDIWGNSEPVMKTGGIARPGAASSPVVHHVLLGQEPIFIENVDVNLTRFIAGFKIDPDFVAARAGEHELAMVLINPFATRAQGRISVLEPGGLSGDPANRDRSWRISPRSSQFSLAPGETMRIPLTVSFSAAEEAGPKPFIAEVQLTADREYGAIRLSSMLDIRLDNVQLDVSYRIAPGGADLIAEAVVTNRGTALATIELTGFAAGYPRAKASVADLKAGESATRRFIFPAGVSRLRGQRIVVGAQDIESQARINRSLVVE